LYDEIAALIGHSTANGKRAFRSVRPTNSDREASVGVAKNSDGSESEVRPYE
jgi:hypothetical protein